MIEPSADGSRVTFSISAELGAIKGLLLGRSVQRTMEAETRAIDRIAGLIDAPEGDATP